MVSLDETLLNSETEIWFMDRSLKWFFITSSFCDYYRIMILSVGIPHWQYLFTEVGLPQHTKVIALNHFSKAKSFIKT